MNDIVAILLCAGKGTRMNDDSTNKVCFEVNGVPAVRRTIDNMKAAGIKRFVAVVGAKSEKVMQCLSCYDGIAYAYQPQQNGTGNAALMGLRAVTALGYEGPCLISMGDKIISSSVISALIDKYHSSKVRTVFAVQPKEFNPSGGRIACKNDRVCGIYEMMDTCLLALGALREQNEVNYAKAIDAMNLNEIKKDKVLKYAKAHMGEIKSTVTLSYEQFTYEEIELTPYVNTATYLCDTALAISAIKKLTPDNAQGEVYLTDAVNLMIRDDGAQIITINSKEDMLTFGTKDELNNISNYFAAKERKYKHDLSSN